MPSLIAILGGDMTQLKAVFDSAKEQATRTGSAIKNSMAVSLGSQAGGALKDSIAKSLGGLNKPVIDLDVHGKSGAMRETLVLLREIGRGNWSRVPGSLSILVGQLGILPMLLSPLFLIPAALAAVFGGAFYLVRKFSNSLVDLKLPDFNPEYIAKHLQRVNQAAEAQKEINREIEKSIALHGSAAEAAKRVADATKDHFEHLRKMNQFEEEKELAKTKNLHRQAAIRLVFARQELELHAAQRAQEIKNKQDEEKALKAEMLKKKQQADEIGSTVPSKAADEQNLKKRKADAEAAQKELDKLKADKEADRLDNEKERGGNQPLMHGLERYGTYDARRNKRIADLQGVINASEAFEDTAAANEEKRKKREDLLKEASAAGNKMVEAGTEGDRLAKEKKRKDREEAEEAAAKLAAQDASHHINHVDVNAVQRIGGQRSGHDATMLDASKKSEQHLKEIRDLLARSAPSRPGVDAVKY